MPLDNSNAPSPPPPASRWARTRRRPLACALAAATLVLAAAGAAASQRWLPFEAELLESCDGPSETAGSGPIEVPGRGGDFDAVACDASVPTVVAATDCDADGVCSGRPLETEGDAACPGRVVMVTLPATARLCEIRFFETDARGRDYRERPRWRNRQERIKDAWRLRGTLWSRLSGEWRLFRVEYTNRGRKSLQFGYEVRFQPR